MRGLAGLACNRIAKCSATDSSDRDYAAGNNQTRQEQLAGDKKNILSRSGSLSAW